VEIGRFRGGSTFLIAAALEQGVLHSYDLAVRQRRAGDTLDRELARALERYGLSDRVHLHIASSHDAGPPAPTIDLLFIDGDHREEAVRADFERWAPLLAPRGDLLFHDAVDAPDFVSPSSRGPARVAASVGKDFEPCSAPGSLAHFVRR
jgi:predicted O-methyltransferase YrrM